VTTKSRDFSLSYHQIGSGFFLGLNRVSKDSFEAHLKTLVEMGFSSASEKSVEIVFDDGYLSTFENALPIMEKYGFTGTVFPVAGYIGKYNDWDVNFWGFNRALHLNAAQIYELSECGWKVGSHGLTHRSLIKMNHSELTMELSKSKEILEEILKKRIDALSPPFCLWNQHVLKRSLKAGYTEIYVQNNRKNVHYSQLKGRHSIYSIDTCNSIKRKVEGNAYEHIKETIIHNCSRLTVMVKEIL
jgi:peptidoglycan/xylan/chitin deacetylase (PgdA/CDA1 family)